MQGDFDDDDYMDLADRERLIQQDIEQIQEEREKRI